MSIESQAAHQARLNRDRGCERPQTLGKSARRLAEAVVMRTCTEAEVRAFADAYFDAWDENTMPAPESWSWDRSLPCCLDHGTGGWAQISHTDGLLFTSGTDVPAPVLLALVERARAIGLPGFVK